MKAVHHLSALLLTMSLPLAWADAPQPGELEELQTPQRVGEQVQAILQQHAADLRQMSESDPGQLAQDPGLQQTLSSEQAAFEQQRQAAEQAFEQ